jgi:hypothetical protein
MDPFGRVALESDERVVSFAVVDHSRVDGPGGRSRRGAPVDVGTRDWKTHIASGVDDVPGIPDTSVA